jgi:hypothetical protein
MNMFTTTIPRHLGLRAGEWVVIRSKAEILSTLDARSRLDGLPFQPEMFEFCGRRMRVAKVAHKTCDTIHKTGGRRMEDTVHLEGARCDGAMHGNCQADCVFFWKEAWLKRPNDTSMTNAFYGSACTEANVGEATQSSGREDGEATWSCQTTSLFEASRPLAWWDIRQYVRDISSGNHSAWNIVKLLVAAGYRHLVELGVGYRILIAAYDFVQRLTGGRPFPRVDGAIPPGQPTPLEALDLKPGEWVQVRTAEEIGATITSQGFNRGMRFDPEMLRYSGGKFRVQMRVDRLINEQTGKMMVMKSPCIQLEDVYCRATCTAKRLGCPRASNTYWREIWLRRIDGGSESDGRSCS